MSVSKWTHYYRKHSKVLRKSPSIFQRIVPITDTYTLTNQLTHLIKQLEGMRERTQIHHRKETKYWRQRNLRSDSLRFRSPAVMLSGTDKAKRVPRLVSTKTGVSAKSPMGTGTGSESKAAAFGSPVAVQPSFYFFSFNFPLPNGRYKR